MAPRKPVASLSLACTLAVGALAGLLLAGAPASHASVRARSLAALAGRSPLSSRLLWATVDVCNPHDQPFTVGIRGSMPGDGNPKDTLYMRFRVQYLQASGKRWAYIAHGADSGLLKLGSADVSRQAGRSFQFAHASGAPAFTLRGVVAFQWRHGSTVLASTYRVTSAGHKSVAGADPKGYSAATCTLTSG
ncbi:MAG: hypothetical protein ACTHM1_05450 [Solirubrobacteraceae bacterium]